MNKDLNEIWKGCFATMYDYHNCKDGNIGVADLIGFEFDE